uniref:Uncharacterized protein n=1 Tax=viral metagenome TaxID=1070528 RepID=A0A6M3KG27_9ZZZZ
MYQKQQLRLLRQDPNAPVVKAAGEREIEKAWAESDIKDWLDAFGQASVQRERESRMNIEKSRLGLAGAKADLNLDIQRRQLASGLGQQKREATLGLIGTGLSGVGALRDIYASGKRKAAADKIANQMDKMIGLLGSAEARSRYDLSTILNP